MQNIFNPEEDYILENSCVLLRPLIAEDISNLLLFALNEPQLWKYSLTEVAGEIPMKNYLSAALAGRKAGKEYPFMVFDKRTQEYAGCTRFYDIQLQNQVMQLGYTWYGSKFHGTGLNQHCKFLLLSFAFEQAGMLRVEFRADNNNARSIAAMKKIGCKVEGVLRSNLPKPDGTRRDSIILRILKNEWEQEVKQLLQAQLVG
jgi:RimJ/RimL family protein N-acetyltransferase